MADHSLLTAVNLVLDPGGPALICKTCQYALAVSKSQVTSHSWEKHKISLASRRDITSYIHSLNIPNLVNLPRCPDRSLVHPHLKVYGSYACLSCIYRTINHIEARCEGNKTFEDGLFATLERSIVGFLAIDDAEGRPTADLCAFESASLCQLLAV